MKLKKNNVYILIVSKAREILEDLHLMEGIDVYKRQVYNHEVKDYIH